MSSGTPRPAQLPLGLAANTRASFDNFIPGANAEVLAAVRATAEKAGGTLFLQGAAGTGKTHLLQAACRASANRGLRALYLSLAEMAVQPPDLLHGLDELDLLSLDDIGTAGVSRAWQVALVALLDSLRARAGRLLFAARESPESLSLSLPDLRSRLGWGARYNLRPLDDAGRADLLKGRAAERGLQMEDEVTAYLLQRAPRDLSSLLGLLDQLDKASLAEKRRLTIPLVRSVLQSA